LRARGGGLANATRVRYHLPSALANKTVVMLTARDLRRWRDDLIAKGVKSANLLRIVRALRAALNLAARNDPHVKTDSWRVGLRPADIADTHNPRNVVLADDQ
jgi:hypothetical protein